MSCFFLRIARARPREARSSGRVGVRPVWKATQPLVGRTAPILKTFVLLDNPSSIILTKTKGGLENTAQGSLDSF